MSDDREEKTEDLQRLRNLLEESQSIAKLGGWELDVATGDLFWTDETYRIHDTSPEEFNPTVDAGVSYFLPESRKAISSALEEAIQHGKDYDLELETYTTKGRKIDVRTTCRVTRKNGKTVKLTGIFQDITQSKELLRETKRANKQLAFLNEELGYLAYHDELTRLPNRSLLADRLEQAISNGLRRNELTAVAFLDLDNFKHINDSYDHHAGDEVLVQLAQRMQGTLRKGDTLARVGGDEFVVVLSGLESQSGCEVQLARLLKAIETPIELDNTQFRISASIGVTLHPQDQADAEQLLRHADHAMYIAKQAGKGRIHFFDVIKDTREVSLLQGIESIRRGLEQDQFALFYQPKVNMQTGELVGVEALIRWLHPEQGIIPPDEFLPTIRNNELSIHIGEWVLRTAIKQINSWQSSGLDVAVSVNVDALQLLQCDFVSQLTGILESFPNVSPSRLQLEILETSALSDFNQVANLINDCAKLGVSFALDDFGTGYSSLAYLKKLPAKTLKIDQSFVRDILDDPEDLVIIRGIIGLAKAFERTVIAEGVETVEHARALLSCGCELAQGYGIARPMKAEDLPGWNEAWKKNEQWRRLLKA